MPYDAGSMRLLVTGGSGYLGGRVCEAAADAGWHVHATVLTGDAPAGVASHRLDVRDADAVAALVARVQPDAVVHTAYVPGGAHLRTVNTHGAEVVARASRTAGARLVHMSSDVVFDGRSDAPLGEGATPSPVHDYGRSKADAERLVAAAHPDAAVVRTSLVYGGPGGPPSPHERVVADVARGVREMAFFDDELRRPVRVDDLAHAVVALAATPHAGPLHLAGPQTISRLRFAQVVARWVGLDPAVLRGAPSPPGRPRALVLDSSRAGRLLGFTPRPVTDDVPEFH